MSFNYKEDLKEKLNALVDELPPMLKKSFIYRFVWGIKLPQLFGKAESCIG